MSESRKATIYGDCGLVWSRTTELRMIFASSPQGFIGVQQLWVSDLGCRRWHWLQIVSMQQADEDEAESVAELKRKQPGGVPITKA